MTSTIKAAPAAAGNARPKFGPPDATYAVDDLVTVWLGGRESQGVVTAAHHHDGSVYEVHTVPGGAGACVGPEDMRREITPQIGQRWVAVTGHILTIRSFDTVTAPAGLIAVGDRPGARVVLASPHWALTVSGPHHPSPTVRRCDAGGERLDGPWWLLRAIGRGWENDHGAACARHAGHTARGTRPAASPAPTT
jgi:hypothetical protein